MTHVEETMVVPIKIQLFCDSPCFEELVHKVSMVGINSQDIHRCKNGHEEVRINERFPRIEHRFFDLTRVSPTDTPTQGERND